MTDGIVPSSGAAPAEASPQTPGKDPNQDLAAGGQGNGATGEMTKEQAREEIRKHKLMVAGQEVEVDDEELKRGYSHQRAANKILQEGKAAKKQAEEFVKMMKDKGKLFEAIQKLGHDPRKLAEEYLSAQLEDEMMDPREKELRNTKDKLRRYEELEQLQKKSLEEQRDKQLKEKYSKEYTEKFVEALKATKLPGTKPMVAAMAKYIHRAAAMKFEMTPHEAAQLVKEDIETAHRNLYGEADADTLVKLLGDQGLQKLRTYETSRLKSPEDNLRTPTEQGEGNNRVRAAGKRMTPEEWRAFNRK